MSPEAFPPGSPADWLRHAESDLALARSTATPKVLLEDLCFHAQQAAEKALKAVLLAKDISLPRTHSIRMLLDLLPEDLDVPETVEGAAVLTEYAVTSRYPSATEPVDDGEHLESVALAEAVLSWARVIV